jgi:hypothetical protein
VVTTARIKHLVFRAGMWHLQDCLCDLVVSSWLQIQRSQVRFPALPDFMRSSGSGTGSTQPCEYKWAATWKYGSGLENRECSHGDPLCWPRDILYSQKLGLTSPISGGRLVSIGRSRTNATEFHVTLALELPQTRMVHCYSVSCFCQVGYADPSRNNEF